MGSSSAVRILVVDDDASITNTLVLVLRSAGFETSGVYGAAEARAEFVRFKPDLVLADVILGDGNGLDLAIEFRRNTPDCRVLLFSGQVTAEDLFQMNPNQPSFGFVAKPLHPKDLISIIANLFEHSVVANA